MMKRWESLVDQKIREAMERGEFDNLEGKGAPVDTSENPFEDPDMRMAYRMLRNAGFAPAWIEERKDFDSEAAQARARLARAWSILQKAAGTHHEAGAKVRWEKQLAEFRQSAADLNKRISVWNLKVPTAGLHMRLIDPEREIEKVGEK